MSQDSATTPKTFRRSTSGTISPNSDRVHSRGSKQTPSGGGGSVAPAHAESVRALVREQDALRQRTDSARRLRLRREEQARCEAERRRQEEEAEALRAQEEREQRRQHLQKVPASTCCPAL